MRYKASNKHGSVAVNCPVVFICTFFYFCLSAGFSPSFSLFLLSSPWSISFSKSFIYIVLYNIRYILREKRKKGEMREGAEKDRAEEEKKK